MVEISASFMDDKVAAAVLYPDTGVDEDDGHNEIDMDNSDASIDGDLKELEPMQRLLEPPDDGGPVEWPMPEFCPLTVDGGLKQSFLESLRKEAEWLRETEQSSDSQPSSTKRHRASTGDCRHSPSPNSPYRNILQVFQQCRQD